MATVREELARHVTQAQQSAFFIDKMKIYNVLSYANGITINNGITDATTAIQAAIDEAEAAGGGKVFFPKGIYIISDALTIDNSNIVLCGAGPSSIIKLTTINNHVITIDNQTPASHVSNIVISNLGIQGFGSGAGNGINVQYADNVLIKGVWATAAGEHGIGIGGGNNHCIVTECFCWNNGLDGIRVFSAAGGAMNDGDINHVTVINNICWDNGSDGIGVNAVYGYPGAPTIFYMGNIKSVIVAGNICINNVGHGLDLKGGGTTIYCQEIIYANNICHDNGGGIFCDGDGDYGLKDLVIEGNIVYSNLSNPGIGVEDVTRFKIVNNLCFESAISGIRTLSSTIGTIASNTCHNNTTHGIDVQASGKIVVVGNNCFDNSVTGTGAGIMIQGADTQYCNVTGNSCFDTGGATQDYGIWEAVSANNNLICNNVLNGNTVAQLSKVGAATLVRNNMGYVTENSGTGTITSGATGVTITHGLSATPAAADIWITQTNNPTNDPGNYYLSSIGATTFNVNVRSDPGAGGVTFSWQARIK